MQLKTLVQNKNDSPVQNYLQNKKLIQKQVFFAALALFFLLIPILAIADNSTASTQLTVKVCLRYEICNNGADDDCDGLIDNNCGSQQVIIYVPGGGGGEVPQAIATIDSIQAGTPTTKKETSVFVLVKNHAENTKTFLVTLTVLGENLIEYDESKSVSVQGNSSELVSFDGWAPKVKGEKMIRARVYDEGKTIVLDEKILSVEVKENILFDLEITKILGVVRPGDSLGFDIKVINRADFYNDFNLSYWVEDSNGNKLVMAEKVIAVKPGTEYTSSESLLLPPLILPETYLLKAQISAQDSKTTAFKSFIVAQGSKYYDKAAEWMANSCSELELKINTFKDAGFDLTQEENSYWDLCNTKINSMNAFVISGKKEDADAIIRAFPDGLAAIKKMLDDKETALAEKSKNALDGAQAQFCFWAIFIIMLIFLVILLFILSKDRKETKQTAKKKPLFSFNFGKMIFSPKHKVKQNTPKNSRSPEIPKKKGIISDDEVDLEILEDYFGRKK